MAANDTIMEIIKNSMEHVVCIDDSFSLPYEDTNEKTNFELSKNLYEGLSKNYDCMVDIIRYDESEDNEQYFSRLKRKDLLILDWELNNIEPKFKSSLECLIKVLETDIPFICIYTNEKDTQRIYNQIVYYFSGLYNEYIEKIEKIINIYALDQNPNYKVMIDKITTWSEICTPMDEEKKILKEFPDMLSEWKKEGIDVCADLNIKDIRICLHLITVWDKKYILPLSAITGVSAVKMQDSSGNIGALNINGKVLIVLKKDTVEAKKILESYSEYLAAEPNNLFNIVWLHYKNKLNRVIFKQGEFFQDISQEAFLFHKVALEKEGTGLDDFIKMLYQDELINKLKLADNLHDQNITEMLQGYSTENVNNSELANLNYYYSINQNNCRKNYGVTFGDIFQVNHTFYMCITALCDCLNAKKIKYNYCFVEGNKVSDQEALSDSEQGFYSFVRDATSKKCISIRWETHRLFTLHIPQDEGKKDEFKVCVRGNEIHLKYLCNQKQNYTQRVANDVFSWANRVGVTYAKLEEKTKEVVNVVESEVVVSKNI